MLGLDLVLATPDVDNLRDVQTFDQIICHNIRCTDDDIIDIFHGKCHQNTLLKTLQRILSSAVVLDQFIIPEPDIKIISLLLGRFETSDHSWMHQVTAGLEVDDPVIGFGIASV